MISEPPAVPPRSRLIWAAVDLDGTLAEGIWSPEDPTSKIGPPIRRNIHKLKDLVLRGWKIHIHTSRPWHDFEMIEAWLIFHKIPYNSIHCGKLLAAVYIDDRAVHESEPTWEGGTQLVN